MVETTRRTSTPVKHRRDVERGHSIVDSGGQAVQLESSIYPDPDYLPTQERSTRVPTESPISPSLHCLPEYPPLVKDISFSHPDYATTTQSSEFSCFRGVDINITDKRFANNVKNNKTYSKCCHNIGEDVYKHEIKIVHINLCSIINKLDTFSQLLADHNFSVALTMSTGYIWRTKICKCLWVTSRRGSTAGQIGFAGWRSCQKQC